MLHSVVERRLQPSLQLYARSHTFVHKLFIFAVLHTLESGNVAGNAERGHFFRERCSGLSFGIKTDADRHELLRIRFFGAFVQHVRYVNSQATGRSVGSSFGAFGLEMLIREALAHAFGKRVRQALKRLGRQLFSLQFNEQIRHFVLSSSLY